MTAPLRAQWDGAMRELAKRDCVLEPALGLSGGKWKVRVAAVRGLGICHSFAVPTLFAWAAEMNHTSVFKGVPHGHR